MHAQVHISAHAKIWMWLGLFTWGFSAHLTGLKFPVRFAKPGWRLIFTFLWCCLLCWTSSVFWAKDKTLKVWPSNWMLFDRTSLRQFTLYLMTENCEKINQLFFVFCFCFWFFFFFLAIRSVMQYLSLLGSFILLSFSSYVYSFNINF